ncbi:MAG: hypothetical protein JWP60_1112 [Ramlibacter sp.]|nr:hypothetical protein [Ramlibacter sp.]
MFVRTPGGDRLMYFATPAQPVHGPVPSRAMQEGHFVRKKNGMRWGLAALLACSLPAFALTEAEMATACYERVKPLRLNPQTGLARVHTNRYGEGLDAYYVTEVRFTAYLLTSTYYARCRFGADGRLQQDDYQDFLKSQEQVRREAAERARITAH